MTLNLTKSWPLIFIVLTAAILRFYQLGIVPPGLFIDEAANGYNAYSILKTAKDEYGNFLPTTFKSFGDYNPAFSVYTLVPSVAIFGLNNFAIRFPSALLGTLSVVLVYLVVKQLTKENKETKHANEILALLSAAFITISPWHLQFSRYDHEANFMLFFALLGIYFLTLTIKGGKNLLILCAISFGVALNTYHGAKIQIPTTMLMLFFVFKKELLGFKKSLIIPAVVLFTFSLPFILNFQNSLIRGQSVGILKDEKPLNSFVEHYLSHYSPGFLFSNGDNIGRHSVSGMGELYIFQIPLLFVGMVILVSKKGKARNLLLGLLLIAPISASLATPAPHALRSIFFVPVWAVVCAIGTYSIFARRSRFFKTILLLMILVVGLYNFILYLHLYYVHHPKERSRDWDDGYFEMVKYVDSQKENYETIAITKYYGHPYIFVLFYSAFDPQSYHVQSANKDAFDKYEFFGANWEKKKEGKALVVTPPWQAHPDKVLKEVYSKNGDLTFTISEAQ